MTDRMDTEVLRELVAAGKPCTLPSPRVPGETVRVMCYAEGYMMVRHKGCMPFIWWQKDALAALDDHAFGAQARLIEAKRMAGGGM